MKLSLWILISIVVLVPDVGAVTATNFYFTAANDYTAYRTYHKNGTPSGDPVPSDYPDPDDVYSFYLRKAAIELPDSQTETVYAAYYSYDSYPYPSWTFMGGLWKDPDVTTPPFYLYGSYYFIDSFFIPVVWNPIGLDETVGYEEIKDNSATPYSKFYEYRCATQNIYYCADEAYFNVGHYYSTDFYDRDTDDESWTTYVINTEFSGAYLRIYDGWGAYSGSSASGDDDFILCLCQSDIDPYLFMAFFRYSEEEEWTFLGSLYQIDVVSGYPILEGSYQYELSGTFRAAGIWQIKVDLEELEIMNGFLWDINVDTSYRYFTSYSGTCSTW